MNARNVMDLRGNKLSTYLGQKKTTRRQAEVPQRVMGKNTNFKPIWKSETVSSNRLFKHLADEGKYLEQRKVLKLHDGSELEVILEKEIMVLGDAPVLYVQFAPDGDESHDAFELSKKDILEGIDYKGHLYEYAYSSGSQMRTLKGVFVRADYSYSKEYLDGFDVSTSMGASYVEFLGGLVGAEAIIEAMTFGAYSHEFTGAFHAYLGEDFTASLESISKFMARVGMAGTSSISLGRDWNVLHIGEIRFQFSESVRVAYEEATIRRRDRVVVPKYTSEEIDEIERKWKETLMDGGSVVKAQKLVKELRAAGYNVKLKDVLGTLTQLRWAGVKGTVFAIDENILNKCRDQAGNHVYADYDMIVEHNSWKYTPILEFYKNDLAPEFELVNISKPAYSNYMNYQFILSLDPKDKAHAVRILKTLVDRQVSSIRNMMTDHAFALKKLGLITKEESPLNEIGVDEYAMAQVSKLARLVANSPESIKDAWFRKKLLDLFHNTEKDVRLGRVEVDGANRYIFVDPTAFLRTDRMVYNEETGLYDIVIGSMGEIALRDPSYAYWDNKNQDCVLFRSPLVHPGESTKMSLTNAIVEHIETDYGFIPARKIFHTIKDVIVLNGFSTALESMGGADIDGDTVLCVLEELIVELKDEMRKPLIVEVNNPALKEMISVQSIKDNMVRSLRDNGIGMVTNYATTWRDIQLSIFMEKSVDKKLQLALRKIKTTAMKNIKMEGAWVMEDESIMRLAGMDITNWVSVYKAINSVLKTLRILQEMAINTAKSGVFVEFGSEDPEKNNYNHLAIDVFPDWLKPGSPEQYIYNSHSSMGLIAKYMINEWASLKKWAMQTSSHILPGVKTNYGVVYQEIYKRVSSIASSYGKDMMKLRLQGLEGDDFNVEFEEMTGKYNGMLTILSAEYGMDAVAVAAYDATNRHSSRTDSSKLSSFVWSCYFEEMIATLQFLDRGKTTFRIYKVFVDRALNYYNFIKGGAGHVDMDKSVYLEGMRIGISSAPEGSYEIDIIDGIPYLKVETQVDSVDTLTTHLGGVEFPIVGFKYNKDKIMGEGFLTREKVIQYLQSPLNQNTVITKVLKLKDSDAPAIGIYVRCGASELMLVGTLPIEYSVIGRAMNAKAFKVQISEKEETDSRLTLRIEKALMDLL